MQIGRESLLAAIKEERPIVLLSGQNLYAETSLGDPILSAAFSRSDRPDEATPSWSNLLSTKALPESFYEWLAERFERRVAPDFVSLLGEIPWSAIFTSSVDQTFTRIFKTNWREPQTVFLADEIPPVVRSRARPPVYFLFGMAGTLDLRSRPPLSRSELSTRRIGQALPMLARLTDTATAIGLIVVDGIGGYRDWLRLEDLLGAIGSDRLPVVLWFGGAPEDLSTDEANDFDEAVRSGRIIVESQRLGTVIALMRALEQMPPIAAFRPEESGVISLADGKSFETSPEERLRIEAVASVVDDTWTSFLAPLGPDADYATFRRFHGDAGGGRLLVEGIRRGYAIERQFEDKLIKSVEAAIEDHTSISNPIVVHGQSATGKSVALARLVSRVRERRLVPVIYTTGRIPHAPDISSFCEAADHFGTKATLIVCDANRDTEVYRDLLLGLRSRGRRVVVVGTQYRMADELTSDSPLMIEAPTDLVNSEQRNLSELLSRFLISTSESNIQFDANMLGFLYRALPASRPRISAGLGAEARATEQTIRARGQHIRTPRPATQFAEKLRAAGIEGTEAPIFKAEQEEVLASSDASGRIVDFVMAAGGLGCPVPLNLLLRTITESMPEVGLATVGELFRNLDLFRWKWADPEQSELLVHPRLTLEAELICKRRLGSAEKESACLLEIVGAIRHSTLEAVGERRFLFDLLHQIGPDGPRGSRYKSSYVEIGRTLTALRSRHGVVHPSLMLQESAFRRIAIRDLAIEGDRLSLLEEARNAVQTALDGIESGDISAPKRTRQNLLVERASIYGFLMNDRIASGASSEEVWSSYAAARTAAQQAISTTDAYFPVDVALWSPSDLLKKHDLSPAQRIELHADIYGTLDQIDPSSLPPKQRSRFETRRFKVAQSLLDEELSDSAFAELDKQGSTAGYYLRARELGPALTDETFEELAGAKRAADYLLQHFQKIDQDTRCLWSLLEYGWIAVLGRRLFRGDRQPIPPDKSDRVRLLEIVRRLNQVSEQSGHHRSRYLEALLAWSLGDFHTASPIFRGLGNETDFEDPTRIVRRHVLTGSELKPLRFDGRLERERSEGHWVVRVEDLGTSVDALARDFPRDEFAKGRTLKGIGIAFNFIGPIADPVRGRQ